MKVITTKDALAEVVTRYTRYAHLQAASVRDVDMEEDGFDTKKAEPQEAKPLPEKYSKAIAELTELGDKLTVEDVVRITGLTRFTDLVCDCCREKRPTIVRSDDGDTDLCGICINRFDAAFQGHLIDMTAASLAEEQAERPRIGSVGHAKDLYKRLAEGTSSEPTGGEQQQ